MPYGRHHYQDPPPLADFGEFITPDGHVWDRTDDSRTNDNNCVAVARHPDGWVCLADTKHDLAQQTPLYFTPVEWSVFEQAIRERRI